MYYNEVIPSQHATACYLLVFDKVVAAPVLLQRTCLYPTLLVTDRGDNAASPCFHHWLWQREPKCCCEHQRNTPEISQRNPLQNGSTRVLRIQVSPTHGPPGTKTRSQVPNTMWARAGSCWGMHWSRVQKGRRRRGLVVLSPGGARARIKEQKRVTWGKDEGQGLSSKRGTQLLPRETASRQGQSRRLCPLPNECGTDLAGWI